MAASAIKTSTTIVDAAQFTTSLLSGKFDGSAAAWKDAERERTLLFSQPYLENRLVLVARRGGDVSAATLADLKGKRIAIVEGYSYGEAIDLSGPTFVRSRTEEDSLKLLLDGKVDYTLMDELVVQYIVSNYAEEARTRLQLGSTPLVTRQLYLAVQANAAGCGVDRQPIQRPAPRHDCRPHLPSPSAPGLDPGGHRRRRSTRARAAERSPGRGRAQACVQPDSRPNRRPCLHRRRRQRFLLGGSIYDGWTTVPDKFKVEDPKRPDPNRSTAVIFRFAW